MAPHSESRPGQATGTASNFRRTPAPDHTVPAPVDGGRTMLHGPAGALDNCPDCHGAVQRFARHSEGLGELWETPLSVNTIDQPYSPRLPGPGIFSLAMDTAARGVTR